MSKKERSDKKFASEVRQRIEELIYKSVDPFTEEEIAELQELVEHLSEEEAIQIVEDQVLRMQEVRVNVLRDYLDKLKGHIEKLRLETITPEIEDCVIYLATLVKSCCSTASDEEKDLIKEANDLISSVIERSGKTIH